MAHIPGMTQTLWQRLQTEHNLHPGLLFYRFLDPSAKGNVQFHPLLGSAYRTAVPFAACLHKRTIDELHYLQSLSWAVLSFEAQTATRLAVGLGIPSPTENGLTMDHIHGIPIIPGSGLKGLCLDWALEEAGLALTAPEITHIFGAQPPTLPDPRFQAKAGRAVFFDALPVLPDTRPPLELDIMNPHYGPYYGSQGGSPPADYYNPNIIYFLTVPQGTTFRFALAVRPPFCQDPQTPSAQDLADTLRQWLQNVVFHWGVGAKTRVGYGLFEATSLVQVSIGQ